MVVFSVTPRIYGGNSSNSNIYAKWVQGETEQLTLKNHKLVAYVSTMWQLSNLIMIASTGDQILATQPETVGQPQKIYTFQLPATKSLAFCFFYAYNVLMLLCPLIDLDRVAP